MRAVIFCRPFGPVNIILAIQGRRAFALAPGYLLAAPAALQRYARRYFLSALRACKYYFGDPGGGARSRLPLATFWPRLRRYR
jgi:hypothetical protein